MFFYIGKLISYRLLSLLELHFTELLSDGKETCVLSKLHTMEIGNLPQGSEEGKSFKQQLTIKALNVEVSLGFI